MLKRSLFAVAALAVSSSVFAMGPMSPLDPQYKAPAFNDIHQGEGPMTQGEYMNYVDRSWKESGGMTIDKKHSKYSDYQKSPRFDVMDKNHDGSISQAEYRGFHEDAWKMTKSESMMQKDYDAWYQNAENPLHPSFKKN
ncbi:MAG: hypothetical protein M3Q00_03735 [Pseudomonadota bacterium]|nr:hypothetical protein [Pseudomonadota bacterium]